MKGNCCLEKGLWRKASIMRLRKQSQFQGRVASPACAGAGIATRMAMTGGSRGGPHNRAFAESVLATRGLGH
jgi:hypothetical protein